MAHPRLAAAGLVLCACGSAASAEAPGGRAPGIDAASAPASAPSFTTEDAAWGRFHSKRFGLSLPLPDGHAWKIDDHSRPELVAVHPSTSSRVTLLATNEQDLMNRERCETRARQRGMVNGDLTTVEDAVTVGPDAYDSRVWVAIGAARPGGVVEGHVYLFGAFLRRCLLVHVSTEIPSANDGDVLSARLAIARARIVGGIALDPMRTTDDATVPREKSQIRR